MPIVPTWRLDGISEIGHCKHLATFAVNGACKCRIDRQTAQSQSGHPEMSYLPRGFKRSFFDLQAQQRQEVDSSRHDGGRSGWAQEASSVLRSRTTRRRYRTTTMQPLSEHLVDAGPRIRELAERLRVNGKGMGNSMEETHYQAPPFHNSSGDLHSTYLETTEKHAVTWVPIQKSANGAIGEGDEQA